MRHAPPVSVLASSRGWRAFQCVLGAVCAAALGGWLAQHLGAGSAMAAASAVAFAGPAAALAWRLAHQAPATLCWDGRAWQAGGQPVQLALMLDLGAVVVLRWQFAVGGKPVWTALSASEAGPAWHALRAALWARSAAASRRPSTWG
ncbi:MAG: hypothetical protein WCJ87_07635 [Burkholderiales bacterium]